MLDVPIIGLCLLGLALVALGVWWQHPSPPRPDLAAGPPAGEGVLAAAPPGSTFDSRVYARAQSATSAGKATDPSRISIPLLQIDARVVPLGLDARGALDVPRDGSTIGWYQHSSRPGEPGPSVFAGHVTWADEPAVLFRLAEIVPGTYLHVRSSDGTFAYYVVTHMAEYDRSNFPTNRVYGPTGEPTLRLITCSGPYDAEWDGYQSNFVVYARLVDRD